MAEEEFIPYKDISELNKELQGMGRKDISNKELHEAVQRLTQTISGMLEVFGAAAEQMRQEEKEYGAETKKHELILLKLDRVIEQNKTIARGLLLLEKYVRERAGGMQGMPSAEVKPLPQSL